MPNSIVKSFAKKSGKSVADVEALWDKAVDLAKKKGLSQDSNNFFAYVTGILKKMVKVESLLIKDAEKIVEGYMDGTAHRIRQTPINNTSKIFKRDSFHRQRDEKNKKKKSNNKKAPVSTQPPK